MSDRYAHIIADVRETPWAILPTKLLAITSLLELRAAGLTLNDADIRARIGGDPQGRPDIHVTANGVGVLPVFGVLSQRMNMMAAISGGTSTEQLAADFRALRDDPKVSAIVLAVDSPGGSVYGIEELADEIRASRGIKPIVAVASSLAASAAYWLAAQADSVVVTPSGDVGSIGVFTAHQDASGAADKMGVKTTLISAGKYKTEGNPFAPLTPEAHAALVARVEACHERFVAGVAAGRGASVDAVRNGYGEGRVLGARAALAAGLVDRIATLDSVIASLDATAAAQQLRPAGARAALRADTAAPLSQSTGTPHEPPATGHDRTPDEVWLLQCELDLLDL
jgi:signal peptide peptidase SppA